MLPKKNAMYFSEYRYWICNTSSICILIWKNYISWSKHLGALDSPLLDEILACFVLQEEKDCPHTVALKGCKLNKRLTSVVKLLQQRSMFIAAAGMPQLNKNHQCEVTEGAVCSDSIINILAGTHSGGRFLNVTM